MQHRSNHAAPSMRAALAGLVLSSLVGGCHPDPRCDGELYYSAGSCNVCPEGSTLADDSCVCDDAALRFEGGDCVLPDGGLPLAMDDGMDAGELAGDACAEYCDFIDGCIAGNSTAVGAAPMVADGLSATCSEDCAASAQDDDPVIACISDGRGAAMCDGSDELAGVLGALSLVDECCLANEGSALCATICDIVSADVLVGSMVTACK